MGLGRQQEFRSGEDGRWNEGSEAKLLCCSKAGWAIGKDQGFQETAEHAASWMVRSHSRCCNKAPPPGGLTNNRNILLAILK